MRVKAMPKNAIIALRKWQRKFKKNYIIPEKFICNKCGIVKSAQYLQEVIK